MAKPEAKKSVDTKYVSLRVYTGRRILVMIVTFASTFLFGFLINHFHKPSHSVFMSPAGVVIAVIGVLMLFLPLTEEWIYAPWQDAGQKCEKNTYM